jgi:hypothetical protein
MHTKQIQGMVEQVIEHFLLPRLWVFHFRRFTKSAQRKWKMPQGFDPERGFP